MEAQKNVRVKFRNPKIQSIYDEDIKNPNIIEFGTDQDGKLYFHYANGLINRCTKQEYKDTAYGIWEERLENGEV